MLLKSLLRVALLSWSFETVLASSGAFFENLKSPPTAQRPKFRYWLPDASVSPEVLEQDIESMFSVGAGGLEFLPYYQYGLAGGGPTPTDWETYGFGTPAFKKLFDVALAAAEKYGLHMDITGAVQGNGIPSETGTPGLSVELVYGNVSLASGESYSGLVPPPDPFDNENIIVPGFFFRTDPTFGASKLIAVLAFRIESSETMPSVSFLNVDESSIIDLTNEVSDGRITFDAPDGNGTYRIMSFYERYTNSRTCSTVPTPVASWLGNGSWLVDHFSADGAKRTTDFWEQHILDESNKELLKRVGQYVWEDSNEFQSAAFWTPSLLEDFKKSRGYSLVPYLPLIFNNNTWDNNNFNPYNESFLYGTYDDNGENRVNIDYRTTLNEGYQRYIEHFEDWSHKLGLKYSNQPAYNLPLDMQADIPLVDVPEDESMAFVSNVDAYRQFSGPAHIAGKKMISCEMGAEPIAYSLTFPEYLGDISKAFAGGSNFMVLHGSPYSGEYQNTTWPGYAAFDYAFAEMHNRHQPSWKYYDNLINYLSRTQLILQEGIPQIDLAFYMFSSRWEVESQYQSSNLQALGFTYEYLSPKNLDLPLAFVEKGILAPNGPSYKALIFSNQSDISFKVISHIQTYAKAGLPIIFVGKMPDEMIGNNVAEDRKVAQATDSLLSLPNVYHVASCDDLPKILRDAGVSPRVSPDNGTALYPVWRNDRDNGADHVYIYNSGSEPINTSIEFTVSSASRPYSVDAWTGTCEPIAEFRITSNGISMNLNFQPGQSRITSFFKPKEWGLASPSVAVIGKAGAVEKVLSAENRTFIQLSRGKSASITTGEGMKTFNMTAFIPPSFELQTWDIQIEDWHPYPNNSIIESQITTHHFTNQTLKPWQQYPGMEDVSGIGKYNASFLWVSTSKHPVNGALVSFGPVLHTIRAWINDHQLPAIDITDARVDISKYLVHGKNKLYVETASTLFNRVKAEANTTMTFGAIAGVFEPAYNTLPRQDHGLIGPVIVTPVLQVEL